MTSPTVAHERLARQGVRPFSLPLAIDVERWLQRAATPWDAFPDTRSGKLDAEICAALDRAIRVAIQQCSHAVPLAAKQIQTGAGQAPLKKFPAGYRGLP